MEGRTLDRQVYPVASPATIAQDVVSAICGNFMRCNGAGCGLSILLLEEMMRRRSVFLIWYRCSLR